MNAQSVRLLPLVECYEVCGCLRLSVSLQQQLPGEYWLRSLHCGLEEFIPASQTVQGFYQYCIFKTNSGVKALINIALLRGVHLLRFVECYEVCSCLRLSVSLQQQLPGEYWLRSLHCGLEEFIPTPQIFRRFLSILYFKTYTVMLWL